MISCIAQNVELQITNPGKDTVSFKNGPTLDLKRVNENVLYALIVCSSC